MKMYTKHGEVTVYAKTVEQEAISQIYEMANSPLGENAHIRIMPDCHAGAGCTIGTTMIVADKVCPNLVGVDIGCGMYVTKLIMTDEIKADFESFLIDLDSTINLHIPAGKAVNVTAHRNAEQFASMLTQLRCYKNIKFEYALHSIGSLGGGNHFIELDKDSKGDYYLVVHSGSRHLGAEVARCYQQKAADSLSNKAYSEKRTAVIEQYKKEGRQQEISSALACLRTPELTVSKDLAYCTGQLLDDYLHDIQIAQEFAHVNRETIVQEISERWSGEVKQQPEFAPCFTTMHNYIDMQTHILRKGAVSAQNNEILLIPINMRDGSLLCCGKGNPEWNYSAPHGAGRLMSRAKAKESISLAAFEKSMQDIYTTSVGATTLDEAPQAYKSIEEILECIGDTVEVLDVLKPVYNFKAH